MSPTSILKKLAISVATLGLLLLVAEAAARIAEPGPFSFRDRNPFLPHDDLHHVHRSSFTGRWDGTWYETNSLGLRGPEIEGKTDGELRIAALGDSCTFGKGVVESETWPRRLESLLNLDPALARPAVVANLGINGYSGRQYRGLFDEIGVLLEPDIVVLGYNLNDFPNVVKAVDAAVYQGKKGLRARMPTWMRDGVGHFALGRWLRHTYYEMNEARDRGRAEKLAGGTAEETPENLERLSRAREQLLGIAESVRAEGAHFVVFLFPYESQVYADAFDDAPVEWLRGVCQEEQIPFVDTLTPFRARAREEGAPDLFLRGDRYHPNAEGYAIVAREVRDALRREGWLPASQD